MPTKRVCAACGKDPAEGFASITVGGETKWLCHPDDGPSCYIGAPTVHPDPLIEFDLSSGGV